MKTGQNCWEAKNCGRGPEGAKVKELGICPAALDYNSDGLNGGENGGRICWAISGTFCGGTIQGSFAQKELSCTICNFYKRVRLEVGPADYHVLKPGQEFKEIDESGIFCFPCC